MIPLREARSGGQAVRILQGDCRRAMRLMAHLGVRVDSIVTDPPYHLTSIVKRFGDNGAAAAKDRDGLYKRASAGFMGQQWDGGDIAFDPETWRLAAAVLKPGGHLLAFGGTRGWHRMACAIEDAGFEIRDSLMFLYGSGFPKSHAIALDYEKRLCTQDADGIWRYADGEEMRRAQPFRDSDANEWAGFGTALKPAFEPIVLARLPLGEKSVAANVLRHGTGAINVGACKIGFASDADKAEAAGKNQHGDFGTGPRNNKIYGEDKRPGVNWDASGRWPANVAHDGGAEVEAAFAAFGDAGGGFGKRGGGGYVYASEASFRGDMREVGFGDSGTAARFFYSAKAGPDDRFGSKHPTVKPVALMRWLVRMVTPPGGLVLDPFAGSGTTGIAALAEGMRAILCEREAGYAADIRARLDHYAGEGGHSASVKARHKDKPESHGPLFGEGT